jgi:hypothetical protein
VPDWSIKIVPVDSTKPAGSAQFVPQNAPVGQPQATWDGDTVSWNNTTDAAHQPWPTDSNYNPQAAKPGDNNYMSDDIPARQSSRPAFAINLPASVPTPYILYYYCKDHPHDPNERGTISIIPVPTS